MKMELNGKRVIVIGLGISGLAAARFLSAHGANLVMTDLRTDLKRTDWPAGDLYLGVENQAWLDGVDLVVASPGVPQTSVLMTAARARHIPLIGELELGSRF